MIPRGGPPAPDRPGPGGVPTYTTLSNSKWTPVVTWGIVAITFGYLGIRVLAMSRDAWAQQLTAGPARLVRAGSAAGRPVPAPAAGTVTESA